MDPLSRTRSELDARLTFASTTQGKWTVERSLREEINGIQPYLWWAVDHEGEV